MQVVLPDGLAVLSRQDQAMDTDRMPFVIEAHRDLRFPVRPQEPPQCCVMAYPVQTADQPLSQVDRQGHVIGRLIRRIAIHDALVATADDAVPFSLGHALFDVIRLLMDIGEDQAGIGCESQRRVGIADIGNDFPG